MSFKKFKQISPRQKIVNLIIFFAIFSASTGFLNYKIFTKIINLKNDTIEEKINIEKILIQNKNMDTIQEKMSEIAPKLQEFDSIFIGKNRELEFITTLEGLANESNVKLKINLTPPIISNTKQFQPSPLSISAQGLFPELLNFIKKIESLNYYVNVQSIILKSTGAIPNNEETGVDLQLVATTYWKN